MLAMVFAVILFSFLPFQESIASTTNPYMRVSGDEAQDWSPRIDGGQMVWFKKTVDPNVRAIMFHDGNSGKQIATINADQYLQVDLDIHNGWVFWEDKDDDDLDMEKWIYDAVFDMVIRISSDAVYDYAHYKFENGKVLWVSQQGLMFYNGDETVKLADAGNYGNYSLNDGYVVWEQGDSSLSRQIMLYSGTDITNLSLLSGAASFSIHKLGQSHPERCTSNGQVVWIAHDGDWEILHYNGATVNRLTDNTAVDDSPQMHSGWAAWRSGYNSLWFYDGTGNRLVSDNINTTYSNYYLYADGLLWWRSDYSLMHYEPDTESSRVLQDATEAYDLLNICGFDEKGVLFYVRNNATYKLKLFDESEIKVLTTVVDPLDNVTWYFNRSIKYQGGYAAWNEFRAGLVSCEERICDPTCHWEPSVRNYVDREVLYHDAVTGEIEQLTSSNLLHLAEVSDLDNGQVVWSGDQYPPPEPNCFFSNYFQYATPTDIFLGGRSDFDLSIAANEITFDKVLQDGKTATLEVPVRNIGSRLVTNIKVSVNMGDTILAEGTIASLFPGDSSPVTLQWNMAWTVKDVLKKETRIEVVVDPDDVIWELSEANNRVSIHLPGLEKGKKWDDIDGRGFIIAEDWLAPYVTPVAIWFDDDANTTDNGRPSRHYNPIASSQDILDDIENDFSGTQYPNGIDSLSFNDFQNETAGNTITTYWKSSPGIILTKHTKSSILAGAPMGAYLNWPMLPYELLVNFPDTLKNLINEIGVTYVLVIGNTEADTVAMVNELKALNLPVGKSLLVKAAAVISDTPNKSNELFHEILKAFGEKPNSMVVTNSDGQSYMAAAPLAAFHNSIILDTVQVVTADISYAANLYSTLDASINPSVAKIIDDPTSDNDIKGVIQNYLAPGEVMLFMVGSPKRMPFGIIREPDGFEPLDSDRDWIASDYAYHHAHPAIVPGGRFPLDGTSSVNYMAMALQYKELPFGDRDVGDGWEDNLMGIGTFNTFGKRNWEINKYWWMDSVIYQLRDLNNIKSGTEITRLFEAPWMHQGGWGRNWYRYDNQWAKWWKTNDKSHRLIKRAPIVLDTRVPLTNPSGTGARGDGIDNDYDLAGSEDNDGRHPMELIRDVNHNGSYDPGTDIIINQGLTDGIQAEVFTPFVDEEIWDGFDNDGDGLIDEDCSFYRSLRIEEVYGEALEPGAPEIGASDYIDLIDTELIGHMGGQGLIIYSGHAWTTNWAMSNMGGSSTGNPAGSLPPLTSDDRTYDQTHLNYNELPDLAPSLVITSACGSSRAWEANNIALHFLRKGALGYIGATAIATGSSEEFIQQMFNTITGGKLHIGKAFKYAVDNLDHNDLWAARFGEGNRYAKKTVYEYTLFGLGTTEVDPGGDGMQYTQYGTPVFDSQSMTWSQDLTVDIPAPVEYMDAAGVERFYLPMDLLTYFSDTGAFPALKLIPFRTALPIGGRLQTASVVEVLPYKEYGISLYKATDSPKVNPFESEPQTTIPEDTPPELYNGPLFPDTLLVFDAESDSLTNNDHVYGSVAAFQVNGTEPRTTLYDQIVLRLTYTQPLGLEETHNMVSDDLSVQATIFSTDGSPHTVVPVLAIETIGGIVHKEIISDPITVGTVPSQVTFTANDIRLYSCVGRITLLEGGAPVAEIQFTTQTAPITLDPNLEAAIRTALGIPTRPIFAWDLEELTSLDASGAGITDLTGIEYCIGLEDLNLEGNSIVDISSLAELSNLTTLNLGSNQITSIEALAGLNQLTLITLFKNQITDLTPLINNAGLGQGDIVDVRDNPLDTVMGNEQISQLELKGVSVNFEVVIWDLNDDGGVDLTDAVLAMQIISGHFPAQTVFISSDGNGDGKIGLEEAIHCLQAATSEP